MLEIVGFWTPDYVRDKLARLRAARLTNLILCIDEERNCTDEELPQNAFVVRYRRRIDAEKVMRILERRSEPESNRRPADYESAMQQKAK